MIIKLNSKQLNTIIMESIMDVLKPTGLHPNTLRNAYKTMVDKQHYERANSFADNLWEHPAFIKDGIAAYVRPEVDEIILGFAEGDDFAIYDINNDKWVWTWGKGKTMTTNSSDYTTLVYQGSQNQPIFASRSVGRQLANLIKKINPDSKFADWGMFIN